MIEKGKQYLVTGGAGLIGSHLVNALIDGGAKVTILDNLDQQTHPHGKPDWINPKARFIHGDCRSREDWLSALSDGVEYVFHQAAFGGFTPQLSLYMDSNATGTALLFETIRDHKLPVKKIVAASSQAVYGESGYRSRSGEIYYPATLRPLAQLQAGRWEMEHPQTGEVLAPIANPEDRPLYTETIYGVSKLAEEKLILGLGRYFGIPTVALRYAVTYGPRQSLFNPYTGVVSIFSTQLLNDLPPVVYEDGEQTRDFLYVSDNVSANLTVMANAAANYQVFSVGRTEAVTVNRLVNLLARYYKKNTSPNYTGEFRAADVRHFVHDSTRLRALGWKPAVSLEDGLEHYVQWISSQKDVREYFSAARDSMRTSGIVRGCAGSASA